MKIVRAAILALAAATLAGAFNGCASGSTAEGTEYSYRVNELIASVPYSIEDVHQAAEYVMSEEMGWVIEESAVDAFDGRVFARGASDNLRRVRLERKGDRLTEVRINIADGPLGDETRSRAVMSRIEERLSGD